jgi:N-acyl-L-homoserine lactone synthetase
MCRDLGWLPPQDYAVPEERDEYDIKQSIIFLAMDYSDNVVGTSRIILPGDIPLPVEKYFKLYPKDEIELVHGKIEYAVEVSRFIVPQNPNFKRHNITQMLCVIMLNELLRIGASHAFVSADHRFFRLLNILGFEFTEIGEPEFYMGSKTIPAITNLNELSSKLAREKPALYELITANGETVGEMSTASSG